MADVMQVVPKTYDLILCLVPRQNELPRDRRLLLGDRIQRAVGRAQSGPHVRAWLCRGPGAAI